MKFSIFSRRKQLANRGQAIVEFAIALPVLLMMLIGIMEVSRMVMMYTLVMNASRDAVRYASAYGTDGSYNRYNYCTHIKSAASKAAYFFNVTTTVTYDDGNLPSPTSLGTCATDGAFSIASYSMPRVNVEVKSYYTPLVKLLPIPAHWVTAKSSRTIMGIYKLK